jgi:hypothetical protein
MIYLGFEGFFLTMPTQIDLNFLYEPKAPKIKTYGYHHASFKAQTFHGQITAGYILKKFFKFEAYTGVLPLFTELVEDNVHTIVGSGNFQYALKKHTIFGFSTLLPVVFHPSLLPSSFDYFFGKLYPFLGCQVALNYLRPIYQFNFGQSTRAPSSYLIRPSIGPCVGFDFTLHSKWTMRLQYRYEYFPTLGLSVPLEQGNADDTLAQNISFKPSAHYFGGGLFYNFGTL